MRRKTVTSPIMNDDTVEIFSDGSCKPNPGPGGWAVVMRFQGQENWLSGGEFVTTNNRMELTAAAVALETLNRSCRVVIHTDSQYVRNGMTKWHAQWIRNDWKTASGETVANIDLWQRLLTAERLHSVKWMWVKAHAGNVMNERVDQLATAARENLMRNPLCLTTTR